MFDTMTLTKTLGAVCGSLLAFLLIGWASASLFYTGGGHGAEAAEQAYAIDTGESSADETAAANADAGVAFAELYAAADPGAGEKVFAKCKACHKVDGSNGTGPYLNGVVDRPKASVAGFGYSSAILALASEAWTPENLNGFLANPKVYLPGTKMAFAGLPKEADRANVIAYLAALP